MLRVYVLSVSRVPVFFHEGTWHIYEGTCVAQACLICFSFSLPHVSPNFGGANEATNLWTRILWWRIMSHVRAIVLYPFNTMWNSRYILNYDDENVRNIQKHLHFNHKGTYIESECAACYPVFQQSLFPFSLLWVGFGGFSKVVATFNHMGRSFNLFMATTGDVWIIPSFRVWGYVHVEHISCVITNCAQHQWVILSPLSIAL